MEKHIYSIIGVVLLNSAAASVSANGFALNEQSTVDWAMPLQAVAQRGGCQHYLL